MYKGYIFSIKELRYILNINIYEIDIINSKKFFNIFLFKKNKNKKNKKRKKS